MKLRTFITILFVGVMGAIFLLFYFKASSLLATQSDQLRQRTRSSLQEYAQTMIEARSFLMSSIAQNLNATPSIVQSFLLSSQSPQQQLLAKKFEQLTQKHQLDLLDGILYSQTKTILGRSDPRTHLPTKTKPSLSVTEIQGERFLLFSTPFIAYGERAGMLFLGYKVDSSLKELIENKFQTKVILNSKDFNPLTDLSLKIVGPIGIPLVLRLSISQDLLLDSNLKSKQNLIILGLLCFILAILSIYLFLEFGFLQYFSSLIFQINQGAQALEKGEILTIDKKIKSPVKEIKSLALAIGKYSQSLKKYQSKVELKSRTEAAGEVASQVAHDLASPLTALKFALSPETLSYLSSQKQNLIGATLERIEDIIRSLHIRNQAKLPGALDHQSDEPASKCMVLSLCKNVLDEKKVEFSNIENLKLRLSYPQEIYHHYIEVQKNHFSRVLSNLINNAVQAGDKASILVEVVLQFHPESKEIEISIRDNGKGIPMELKDAVMERGASHQKSNGTGLGLWHAKQKVEAWGGRLSIGSTAPSGTTLLVLLPIAHTPKCHLAEIDFTQFSQFIIIDDDPSYHHFWKTILMERNLENSISPYYFSSQAQYLSWEKDHHLKPQALVISDYMIHPDEPNGIDLLKSIRQKDCTKVLMTSFGDRASIQRECIENGFYLLSKAVLSDLTVLPAKKRNNP